MPSAQSEEMLMAKTTSKASNGKGAGDAKKQSWTHLFSLLASATSNFAGKPQACLIAALSIAIWAICGPIFGFSDTWQLVINTATTIITFLMVFLIQHTQNRDTLAVQLKLAELIIAVRGAQNRVATIEDMGEDELEQLHQEYRARAETTLERLEQRRGQGAKKRR